MSAKIFTHGLANQTYSTTFTDVWCYRFFASFGTTSRFMRFKEIGITASLSAFGGGSKFSENAPLMEVQIIAITAATGSFVPFDMVPRLFGDTLATPSDLAVRSATDSGATITCNVLIHEYFNPSIGYRWIAEPEMFGNRANSGAAVLNGFRFKHHQDATVYMGFNLVGEVLSF